MGIAEHALWLLLAGAGAFIGIALSVWLKEEIGAASHWALKRSIRYAASFMPQKYRVETEAEWLANVAEIKSPLGKLLHVFNLLIRARSSQTAYEESDLQSHAEKTEALPDDYHTYIDPRSGVMAPYDDDLGSEGDGAVWVKNLTIRTQLMNKRRARIQFKSMNENRILQNLHGKAKTED